jgi:hydrogenase expression/formation protein HypC
MELISLNNSEHGVAVLNGVKYDVDLSLTPGAAEGDFLIVHAGFAIEILDKEEADRRIELFEEMASGYADTAGDVK